MAHLKISKIAACAAALLVILNISGCKSSVETSNKENVKSTTAKNEEVIEKADDNRPSQLYLMVRLIKQKGSDVPAIIGVERSVTEKQGNPLPVPSANIGTAFKCELKAVDGSTIATTTQNANFEYGDGKNEAILKFILPVAEEIEEAVVSYQTNTGEWKVLLEEEMHDE